MGGFGSGRRKAAHLTGECLQIDTSLLLKKGFFTGKPKAGQLSFTSTQPRFLKRWETAERSKSEHSIYVKVQQPGALWQSPGQMTLSYGVKRGNDIQHVRQEISMVTTRPTFGGVRWWFLAPCCGVRVRVLYLPVWGEHSLPQCRKCLGLNYKSQRQSYVERHKTYELHLLRNFGYWWAQNEYRSLKEHHLKLTPEIIYMAKRSQLVRELEVMKRLIRCQRMMLRDHLRALRSLKSEQDRRVYINHLVEQHGETYMLDLIRTVKLALAGPPVEEKAFEEQYMELAEKDDPQREPTVMKPEQLCFYLKFLIERKHDAEEQLKQLVPVAA